MTALLLDPDRANVITNKVSEGMQRIAAWPRQGEQLHVVSLNVEWVRFSVLNHRTSAEQLRVISQTGDECLFSSDPLGSQAQQAQRAILEGQPAFPALRADLKQRGQQEAAIVTADGVLINGNRRAAALRSLWLEDGHRDSRYISCLVLPRDATEDEVLDLETELQVAQDFKEDYSWVNEALLIEKHLKRHKQNFDRVAQRMHRLRKDIVVQYEKLLELHQLVDLTGGRKLHVDFIPNESAFTELVAYLKGKSPEDAESIRTVYFLGTLCGVNYRDLRHLRRPDAAELVTAGIESDPATSGFFLLNELPQETDAYLDPLDDALGRMGPEPTPRLQNLLKTVARADAASDLTVAGAPVPMTDVLRSLKSSITFTAEDSREQLDDKNALAAPADRAEKSLKALARLHEAVIAAKNYPNWGNEDLLSKLSELRVKINEIEAIC